MTAVKSNDTAELLLLNGDAATTYDAITDPNATYVSANPADNHYFWPVVGVNFLYFNMTQAPFNNLAFRKAVAEALNDNTITERAYYGAIPAGNGPVETGVPNGQDSEWVPSSLSSLEWTYNPTAAASTLSAAGYKDVNGSLENPAGQVLPTFNILVGAGWTDYISIAQTIGEELSPLGIHTTIDQQPYSTYAASASAATYSMLVSWSNNTPDATPYPELNSLLDGNVNTDWERYTSAADTAALASFASTTSLTTQKADLASVEKDILTNVPVVALTGRPDFFDYSTKYFTGWPSAADPYNAGEAPDNFTGGAEQMYLNVHLK
jgi:peptide/nickel transport system substrate-binding protein